MAGRSDAYWLDKLCSLICESPGITFTQLARRSQSLTAPERERYLFTLRDAHKITIGHANVRGGQVCGCFWPVTQSATAATPADKLTSTLNEAKRLLASLAACIEAASGMVDEMATAGPVVAGQEIANVPAGEAADGGVSGQPDFVFNSSFQ